MLLGVNRPYEGKLGEHLVEINLVPATLMSVLDSADHDDRRYVKLAAAPGSC